MACQPPYRVGRAPAGSPVASIESIFPCCSGMCPNGISKKPTGCLSPCGDNYPVYDLIKNGWQCYSSFIDSGPYTGYAIIDVLAPATDYLSITLYARRNWGYYFPARYSTQVFFEDLCCVTFDPQLQNYKGQFVAANSGTYRIKMAKWPRYYANFFGGVTYIDNPVENPPPMEDKGYLRTTLPPPYQSPQFCGIQINPNYSNTLPPPDPYLADGEGYPEGAILTRSPQQIVALTIVFGADCSIKFYYGYHEIPINAGDSFVTRYITLPLEIPSFRWYTGVDYAAYDTPAVSLPFMSVMSPENDAGAWTLLQFYNTGGCSPYSYFGTAAHGGVLQAACANSRPMTMAFRRKMIQNKIASRIKKIHYKT
jgi:hypothetical protein